MTDASILWRRLETPGHDACRFVEHGALLEVDLAGFVRHYPGLWEVES